MENEPQRKLRHTDYYSVSTIRRMGFKKENGNWTRKGQEIRTEEEIAADLPGPSTGPSHTGASEAGPSHHPSPPPQHVIASGRFSEEQLDQLRTLLAEQDSLRTNEINLLRDELRLLKEEMNSKLDSVSSSIDKSVEAFSSEIHNIFEHLESISDRSAKYTNSTNQLRRDIDFAIDQISMALNDFKKNQKEDIMEMIGHLKKIVFKHT